MALVIDLKADEKIHIGSTLITNDKQRTRLRIDGDAPVLRQKDFMDEESATTPSKKLYFTTQSMYLTPSDMAYNHLNDFFLRLDDIRSVAPHISNFLNKISAEIIQGSYYKALKLIQDLMNFEENGNEPINDDSVEQGKFSQSHMEAQMLGQATEQLIELRERWDGITPEDRESIIQYNRKLWMVFFDGINTNETSGNKGEFDITRNIINLYNYIYKHSKQIINDDNKDLLNTLIQINIATATALKTS